MAAFSLPHSDPASTLAHNQPLALARMPCLTPLPFHLDHPAPPLLKVEVRKVAAGDSSTGDGGTGAMVRACIAKLPPGYARVEIHAMQDDQIWGLDAWDT